MRRKKRLNSEKEVEGKLSSKDNKRIRQKEHVESTKNHPKRRKRHSLSASAGIRSNTSLLVPFNASDLNACSLPSNVLLKVSEQKDANTMKGGPENFFPTTTPRIHGVKSTNDDCKKRKEIKTSHSLIEKTLGNGDEIKRSLDSAELESAMEFPPLFPSLPSSSSPLISISTPFEECVSTSSLLQTDRTHSAFSNSSESSFVSSASKDLPARKYPSPPSTPPLRAVVSPGSCKGTSICPSTPLFASTLRRISTLSCSPRSVSPLPSFVAPPHSTSPTRPLDASFLNNSRDENHNGEKAIKREETMRTCDGGWCMNDRKEKKAPMGDEQNVPAASSLYAIPFCSSTVTSPRTSPVQPSTPFFSSFASVLPPNLRRLASFLPSSTAVLDGEVPPGTRRERMEEELGEEKECSRTTSASSETSRHSSRHGTRHRENTRSPSPFKPAVGDALSFSPVLPMGNLSVDYVMRTRNTQNSEDEQDERIMQTLSVAECRRRKWAGHEEMESGTGNVKSVGCTHVAGEKDSVAMKKSNEEPFDDTKWKRGRKEEEGEKLVGEETVRWDDASTREQTFHVDAMTWISGDEDYQREMELLPSSSLFVLPPSALPVGSQGEQKRDKEGKMKRGDKNAEVRENSSSRSESNTAKQCCSTLPTHDLPKDFSQLPASSSFSTSTEMQDGRGSPEDEQPLLPLVSPLLVSEQLSPCCHCCEDDVNASRIQRKQLKNDAESDEEGESVDDEEEMAVEHYLHLIARAAKNTGFANTGNDCYACSVTSFLVRNTVFSETLKRFLEAHLPVVEKRWKSWMAMKVGGLIPPSPLTEKFTITNYSDIEDHFATHHDYSSSQNGEEKEEHVFQSWAALYPAHSAFRLLLFEVEQREFLFSVTMRLLHQRQSQKENRQRWQREHAKTANEEVSTAARPFHSPTFFSSSLVGSQRDRSEETFVSQCPLKRQMEPTYSNGEHEKVQEKDEENAGEHISDEMMPLWYLHLAQRIIGMPQTPLSFTMPSPLLSPPSSSAKFWEHPRKKKRADSSSPFDCQRYVEGEGEIGRSKEKQNDVKGEWRTASTTTVIPRMMEANESLSQTGRKAFPYCQRRLQYAWMRTRQALQSIITSSEFSAFQKGISLAPLCRAVGDNSVFFSGYQEDAHEFFVYVMNLLEKEAEQWTDTKDRTLEGKFADDILPTPPRSRSRTTSPPPPQTNPSDKPENTSSSSSSFSTLSSDVKLQWRGEIQDASGVWMCKLIQGQLLNLVRCRNAHCQHETVTVEPFINLGFSLPTPCVPSTASTFSPSISIQSLLVETLKYEALDGYFCDKCQSSLHQFQGACFFGAPPPLLVFQIKRFTAAFDALSTSMVMSKNTTPVALSENIEVTALTDKRCISGDFFINASKNSTGKSIDKHYYYYNEEQKALNDALHQCECEENAPFDFLKTSSANHRQNNVGESGKSENESEKSEEITVEGRNGTLKACKNVHALKGKYRLQSIVEHHGSSLQCGHYTCSFREASARNIPTENKKEISMTRGSSSLTDPVPAEGTQINGKQEVERPIPSKVVWHKANDKVVTIMDRNAIQSLLFSSSDCYLVLYERCSLQETLCPINDVMPPLPSLV